ncbi:MMPL family transporter [Alteromonas ponticola]|uniref:MMPL family transporter n=1 Tax=Alteromonas ponticola TaxID=2720613 RepID=A0ABX1R2K0_9ALTE|nr:MMPL family transporter [Alteromonas ponticola]NMH60675.1 MMPL family transporter [Alteromonas ponticola]
MTLFVRIVFIAVVLLTIAFFAFNSQHIRIDTNLNDLNPQQINDADLKAALDLLSQDVSHRFVMVVKGRDVKQVANASAALKRELDTLPALTVIVDEQVQSNYLQAVTPFRFNFLNDAQRQALSENTAEQLATQAQRKLYQLGDGVRLIPFEQDPLGWFSDYVLARFDQLNVTSNISRGSDDTFTSFVVSFTEYPASLAEQENLYQLIQALKASVSEQFQVTVLNSGMFFFAVDSAQSAKADIQLIAVGSIVGILVLMLVVFRSLLPLLLSLGSIAIGVGFGVVSSTLMFGSIHILTIVFGASLIGIVVDYSLHYFYHFLSHQHATREASGPPHTLFRAMLLSVITSLIGYGALALSDLLILQKVALFSCSGLVMAWLSVMILGPLVIKRPLHARQTLLRRVIDRCQALFGRRPRLLALTGVVLGCVAAAFIIAGHIKTNDDPRLFFHVSPALLAQEQEVSQLTQVYEAGRYLLVSGPNPEAIFRQLDTLYTSLGTDSQSLLSVLDWLPSPASQTQNYERQKGLYTDGGVLDQFSQRLGLDPAQFAAVKAAYLDANGKVLTFTELMQQLPSLPPLWIETQGTLYSFALVRKDSDLAKIEAASSAITGIEYVNTLANASGALKAQRETGAQLLLLAYTIIALLLAVYYRKISAVLLLLIPLSASAITLTAVALMGQAITVFHIMALFLVLGLGMDYIIFAKEMAARRETTQQAILLSAVTSLLSFGLLAFSSMPIVQAFGSTILIGNTINFIAAISLFNDQQTIQEKRPDVG